MLQLTTVLFLITSSILAVIHNLALQLYLYWRFWWFDIPMHLIGGLVVSLGLFTLFDLRFIKNKKFLSLVWLMSFVLFAAVTWEVFEYVSGVPIQDDFVFDTSLDLIMGLLGGYLGYIIGCKMRHIN